MLGVPEKGRALHYIFLNFLLTQILKRMPFQSLTQKTPLINLSN